MNIQPLQHLGKVLLEAMISFVFLLHYPAYSSQPLQSGLSNDDQRRITSGWLTREKAKLR